MNNGHGRLVKLGDLFRIKHGWAFKGEHFVADGNDLLLTPGNFKPGGGLKGQGNKEKFYASHYPPQYLLSAGDLLVVMTDLTQEARILGAAAVVPPTGRFLHNQRLGKITDIDVEQVDPKFLYYLLNSRVVRDQLVATATGTTVRHTAPERIYAARAQIPSLAVQREIAAVLSNYDVLIEINDRRIDVVTEMMSRVYDEWFCDLRHPAIPSDQSWTAEVLPPGWQRMRLGEFVKLEYGKALRAADRRPGRVPVYGSSGQIGWHDTSIVTGPGIVVGRKGNVGSLFWSQGNFYPIDTVFFVRSSEPLRWLFQLLKRQRFIDGDAAVPGLKRNQALSINVIKPPVDAVLAYETYAEPLGEYVDLLAAQNDRLMTVRVDLLDRLINGEVRVQVEGALEAA